MERYAVKGGLWSDVSVWDGGATLPGVGDTVFANGKTVTVNQNIAVDALSIAAGSTAVTGGVFVVDGNAPAELTIDLALGIQAAHNQTGNSIASNRTRIIDVRDGAKAVTIDTNGKGVFGGAGSYRIALAVMAELNGNASSGGVGVDVTVTGAITGGGSSAYGLYAAGGTITVTGAITGGSGSNAYGLYATGGTITVTGDITGGGGGSAYGLNAAGGTTTITGNLIASPTHPAASAYITSNAQVQVDGIAIASEFANAITGNNNIAIAVKGARNHYSGNAALNCSRWVAWDADEFIMRAYTDLAWPDPQGSEAFLTRFGTNLPVQADVRKGTKYGQNNNLTGELHVGGASLDDIAAVTGAQIAAATNKDS